MSKRLCNVIYLMKQVKLRGGVGFPLLIIVFISIKISSLIDARYLNFKRTFKTYLAIDIRQEVISDLMVIIIKRTLIQTPLPPRQIRRNHYLFKKKKSIHKIESHKIKNIIKMLLSCESEQVVLIQSKFKKKHLHSRADAKQRCTENTVLKIL